MNLKFATPALAAILMLGLLVGHLPGQQPQPPSQRFQPARTAPPSVHVPVGQVKSLNTVDSRAMAPSNVIRGGNSTSYNFSDATGAAFRPPQPPANNAGMVGQARQVSFEQPTNGTGQPQSTPGTLTDSLDNGRPRSPIENYEPHPRSTQIQPPPAAPATPASNHPIIVDARQFEQEHNEVQTRMNQLRQMRQSQGALQQVAYLQEESSRQPGRGSSRQAQPAVTTAGTLEPQVQSEFAQVPSANRIASAGEPRELGLDAVQQVSAESEMMSQSRLNLMTPSIQVEAFGPESVGINKIATYRVTVSNEGTQDTENLKVGIDFPESIEMQNINITGGHQEITDGIEKSRLIWKLDRIMARSKQTITINAVPRSAEPFDMGVTWSFEPRVGSTHVQVTEPRLEMKISGPVELRFGEKSLYDVSVSNPGTGAAENVTVALPEALGGERTAIGDIPAGGVKQFKVELYARTAGPLNLAATAVADGNVTAAADHEILVRRANLEVAVDGPPMKYAGSQGEYKITVTNNGDATATEVVAVMALPHGVTYVNGINNAEASDSGLKWMIGTMTAGDQRTYQVNCQLDASGDLMIQAGVRGAADLAATSECQTRVETIADLVLTVEDPKGPLPTGENVAYRLRVKNRGTRSAAGVNLVMQFSEGIEPVKADGFKNKIATGQVVFDPISRIDPGQEIELKVTAQALKSGTHIFRAQLVCPESDSREIAEGTTRFFGEEVAVEGQPINQPFKANTADADGKPNHSNDFK